MARITVWEAPEDEAAFVAAWRAKRRPLQGLLLRSHSPHADFRFAELADTATPPPELPARARTARYEVVEDDLPDEASYEVVLVNPFDVPTGDDEAFIASWSAVRDIVKRRPGYLGSRLHRALDQDARLRFVNVSPWASVAAFTAAVADPAFAAAARAIYHSAHPSLFVAVGDP